MSLSACAAARWSAASLLMLAAGAAGMLVLAMSLGAGAADPLSQPPAEIGGWEAVAWIGFETLPRLHPAAQGAFLLGGVLAAALVAWAYVRRSAPAWQSLLDMAVEQHAAILAIQDRQNELLARISDLQVEVAKHPQECPGRTPSRAKRPAKNGSDPCLAPS